MNETIRIFEDVRDIPYEVGPLYEGNEMVKYGRGGCGPKNRLLAQKLTKIGYKVKICRTPYSWKNLSVLPKNIKEHPQAQQIGNHIYLKVLIGNQWILLDASWDKKLFPQLPANINWDGESNQACAVSIVSERCLDNPESYLLHRKSIPKTLSDSDRDFAKIINRWFEYVRKS